MRAVERKCNAPESFALEMRAALKIVSVVVFLKLVYFSRCLKESPADAFGITPYGVHLIAWYVVISPFGVFPKQTLLHSMENISF